jgi:hypothetical protein
MEITFKYPMQTQDMLEAIIEMKELYAQAWPNEYCTYRLEVGLGNYDLEFQSCLKLQSEMDEVRRIFDPEKELPSPESLFYRYKNSISSLKMEQ